MFGKPVSAGPPRNSGGILTDFAAFLPTTPGSYYNVVIYG